MKNKLSKKMLAVVGLSAVLAILGVVVAFVQYAPVLTTATVQEPITFVNTTAHIWLFPNECSWVNTTLHNDGNATVTVDFTATVTTAPPTGSTSDITLTPDSGTVDVPPHADTVVAVHACADNGIVPGDYTIEVDFQRA